MARFRIKIISKGVVPSKAPTEQDEILSVSGGIEVFYFESVCDYNIIIVRLADVDFHNIHFLGGSEVTDFLSKPSAIICLSREGTAGDYYWLPGTAGLEVLRKRGESLRPTNNSGRFINLFNDYEWKWGCSFNKLPERFISMANNISGQSVAMRADIDNGRIFVIPNPEIDIADSRRYSEFLRRLIDISKEEVEELTHRERVEPDWIEKYVVSEELELRDKINQLQEQYQTLKEAHKLFYEMGKALTKSVNFVVTGMGFDAQMKEDEGIHDIEISEGDFNLVVEVTSSEDDWINISKTRQLLDWCRRFEREKGSKPKGMLIANPYSNFPLPERDLPFTSPAIKQGEAEDFCLMTTVQLYNIFCKFLKGEIDKDKIKGLLLDTKGLLKLEE